MGLYDQFLAQKHRLDERKGRPVPAQNSGIAKTAGGSPRNSKTGAEDAPAQPAVKTQAHENTTTTTIPLPLHTSVEALDSTAARAAISAISAIREENQSDAVAIPLLPAAIPVRGIAENSDSPEELRQRMAAENERRRDWFREPVEGWPERIEIRSALTGETTVINLNRTRH